MNGWLSKGCSKEGQGAVQQQMASAPLLTSKGWNGTNVSKLTTNVQQNNGV
jgi:hypothetical protein